MRTLFTDNFHKLTVKLESGEFYLYSDDFLIYFTDSGDRLKSLYNQLVDIRNEKGLPKEGDPPMKICSWCGYLISDGNVPASHGLCADCAIMMEKDQFAEELLTGGLDDE